MMRRGYIYVIINKTNGKYYYGKTFDINSRWIKHKFNATQKINRRLYDSMNCHGHDNFSIHKISEIECDNTLITQKLNELETHFIKISYAQNPLFGYNMTDGGDGGDTFTNHPNKAAIVEKRRIKNTGKKRTLEFCQRISEITQNYYKNVDKDIIKERNQRAMVSREIRIKEKGFTEKEIKAQEKNAENLSQYNKSEEGRERVSKQFKGKKKEPFSTEHRKNIGKSSKGRLIPGKSINIMNLSYASLHEASRTLNIPLTTIRNRLVNQNFKDWYYL